jgi:hypothetical protein
VVAPDKRFGFAGAVGGGVKIAVLGGGAAPLAVLDRAGDKTGLAAQAAACLPSS